MRALVSAVSYGQMDTLCLCTVQQKSNQAPPVFISLSFPQMIQELVQPSSSWWWLHWWLYLFNSYWVERREVLFLCCLHSVWEPITAEEARHPPGLTASTAHWFKWDGLITNHWHLSTYQLVAAPSAWLSIIYLLSRLWGHLWTYGHIYNIVMLPLGPHYTYLSWTPVLDACPVSGHGFLIWTLDQNNYRLSAESWLVGCSPGLSGDKFCLFIF